MSTQRLGQNGSGFTTPVNTGTAPASGDSMYFAAGYTGTPGPVDTAHVYVGSTSSCNFVKVCVYNASGTLVSKTGAITPVAGLNSAALSPPLTLTATTYFLVVVPDTGYNAVQWDTSRSAFGDDGNTAANFSYASPPSSLPAHDFNAGYEFVVYLTGADEISAASLSGSVAAAHLTGLSSGSIAGASLAASLGAANVTGVNIAQPLFEQSANKATAGTLSSALAFPQAVLQGSLKACVVAGYGGATSVVSASDNVDGAYSGGGSDVSASNTNATLGITSHANATAGAATVTAAQTVSGYLRFAIYEFINVALVSPLDKVTSGTGNNANPTTGNSAATSQSVDLRLAAVAGASGTPVITAVSPDVLDFNQSGRLAVEYSDTTVAGIQSAAFKYTNSDFYCAVLATYKGIAAGNAYVSGILPAGIYAYVGQPAAFQAGGTAYLALCAPANYQYFGAPSNVDYSLTAAAGAYAYTGFPIGGGEGGGGGGFLGPGDVLYPNNIPGVTFSVVRTPRWNTGKRTALSGKESRVAYQPYPLIHFELEYEVLRDNISLSDLKALVGLFNATQGRLDSFLFTDPDFNTVSGMPFALSTGLPPTGYQLIAVYANTGAPGIAEAIENLNGVPTLYDNGTLIPATNYTIGPTGVVTFSTPPAAGHALTWSGSFYYRCAFDADDIPDLAKFMYQFWTVKIQFTSVLIGLPPVVATPTLAVFAGASLSATLGAASLGANDFISATSLSASAGAAAVTGKGNLSGTSLSATLAAATNFTASVASISGRSLSATLATGALPKDGYPLLFLLSDGGTQNEDQGTATAGVSWVQMASRRHYSMAGWWPNWSGPSSGTAASVCAAVKAANVMAVPARILNYYIVQTQPSGAGTTGVWATMFNMFTAAGWWLYNIAGSGAGNTANIVSQGNGRVVNVTSAAPLSGGQTMTQWYTNWLLGWNFNGVGQAANPNLDGLWMDNYSSLATATGFWNLSSSSGAAEPHPNQDVRTGQAGVVAALRAAGPAGYIQGGNVATSAQSSDNTTGLVGTLDVPLLESQSGQSYALETASWGTSLAAVQKAQTIWSGRANSGVVWHADGISSTTGQDYASGLRGDPNWQGVRYTIGAAMVLGCYYCPTGNQQYGSTNQFNLDVMNKGYGLTAATGYEYLGQPLATAQGAIQTAAWQSISGSAIWRRDFANGIVLVRVPQNSPVTTANTTAITVTAAMLGSQTYYLYTSSQDSTYNGGAVTSWTFPRDRDSIILLNHPA